MYEPQEDSYLLLESIHDFANKNRINTALDMGTGSGILGKELLQYAKTVIMTDINRDATFSLSLEISKLEKNKNANAAEIRIYTGDLFEKIPEEFLEKIDLIVFNPPYLPREPDEKDDIELTSGESGIETTKRFLTTAKKFLSKNGTIFFVASSLADLGELERYMKKDSYEFEIDRKKHISFEDIIIYRAKLKKQK